MTSIFASRNFANYIDIGLVSLYREHQTVYVPTSRNPVYMSVS